MAVISGGSGAPEGYGKCPDSFPSTLGNPIVCTYLIERETDVRVNALSRLGTEDKLGHAI